MKYNNGFTLAEVLISIFLLVSTGSYLLYFLYSNNITEKAWYENYGIELSKITILTKIDSLKDSTNEFEHIDANKIHWKTLVTYKKNFEETLISATSIRNKKDSTKTLYYVIFEKESSHEYANKNSNENLHTKE